MIRQEYMAALILIREECTGKDGTVDKVRYMAAAKELADENFPDVGDPLNRLLTSKDEPAGTELMSRFGLAEGTPVVNVDDLAAMHGIHDLTDEEREKLDACLPR